LEPSHCEKDSTLRGFSSSKEAAAYQMHAAVSCTARSLLVLGIAGTAALMD
jgi:hypothetical protein